MLKQLKAMQDEKYRDFHAKLIPTVAKDKIIGIQTPKLRKFAKALTQEEQQAWMNHLPHTYFEENQIHAFCIEQIKDISLCIQQLDVFLPYVDNWATCDMMRPKCFKHHKEIWYPHVLRWLQSEHEYSVRYAIQVLMLYDLSSSLQIIAKINHPGYYVKMMQGWYYATAMIHDYHKVIDLYHQYQISDDIFLIIIQKALDSYRISNEHKEALRKIRTKIRNHAVVSNVIG